MASRHNARKASRSFHATQLSPPDKVVSSLAVRKINTENLENGVSQKSHPDNHWAFPEDVQVSNLSVTNNDNIMTIKKRLNLMNLLKDKMNQLKVTDRDRKWLRLYK